VVYGSGAHWRDQIDWGVIYYANADGSSIRRVRGNLLTPNGIGLSPDESRLYVAETFTSRVWEFQLSGPGQLAPDTSGETGPLASSTSIRALGPVPGVEYLDSLAGL